MIGTLVAAVQRQSNPIDMNKFNLQPWSSREQMEPIISLVSFFREENFISQMTGNGASTTCNV
jgi:hypothetical protein